MCPPTVCFKPRGYYGIRKCSATFGFYSEGRPTKSTHGASSKLRRSLSICVSAPHKPDVSNRNNLVHGSQPTQTINIALPTSYRAVVDSTASAIRGGERSKASGHLFGYSVKM